MRTLERTGAPAVNPHPQPALPQQPCNYGCNSKQSIQGPLAQVSMQGAGQPSKNVGSSAAALAGSAAMRPGCAPHAQHGGQQAQQALTKQQEGNQQGDGHRVPAALVPQREAAGKVVAGRGRGLAVSGWSTSTRGSGVCVRCSAYPTERCGLLQRDWHALLAARGVTARTGLDHRGSPRGMKASERNK